MKFSKTRLGESQISKSGLKYKLKNSSEYFNIRVVKIEKGVGMGGV